MESFQWAHHFQCVFWKLLLQEISWNVRILYTVPLHRSCWKHSIALMEIVTNFTSTKNYSCLWYIVSAGFVLDYLIGRKASRKSNYIFFTSDYISPQLNFKLILFNPARTFPTFFKTWRRTSPTFLTRPNLLPSNFKVH